MKNTNKALIIMFLALIAVLNPMLAQENFKLSPIYTHVFDKDPLRVLMRKLPGRL
jgi:hypothetical protein